MTFVEMTVEGIGIDPSDNPLILLRDAERQTLVNIWVGPKEAVSIQRGLDSAPSVRPMTHDLMTNVFQECGISLVRVTLNDFEEGVYYASLHLQSGNGTHEIDARPSDAIALALRAKVPILVSEKLIQEVGIQRIQETLDTPEETS